MKYFLRLLLYSFYLLAIIMSNASARPEYREDYQFEKAYNAFYKVHFTAADWWNARIRCEAEGTELMVPDTLDEADTMPLLIASIHMQFDGIYVGMHDLYSERYFITIKGNKIRHSILDLLWELEEPKHSGGRCVAMRRNGRLYVNPCSKRLPYICKIKSSQISYNTECDTYDPRWKLGHGNSSCYITHEEPQSWHEAYGTCLSAGGYLAVPDSRKEAEYIRELFKNIGQHKTPSDFAFMGFSDLFDLYHYRTVHGDRVNMDIDWDLKCPRTGTTNIKEERCGGIRRSGLLDIAHCSLPAMFFCEKPRKGSYIFKGLRSAALHNRNKVKQNN